MFRRAPLPRALGVLRAGLLRGAHAALTPGRRDPSHGAYPLVVCSMAGAIPPGHFGWDSDVLHLVPVFQASHSVWRVCVAVRLLRAPPAVGTGLRWLRLSPASLQPLQLLPPGSTTVTSKPDLYPLVITCGEGEGKAGNYLMVQYFRNYVIRAPGSISAASTAESLNSSFICNAANEANSIIPPPYSCASNYEDCVGGGCGRSLLRSLSSLTEPRETRAPPPPRSHTAPDPVPPRRDTPSAFRQNLITSPVQPLDPAFDLELELIDCEMYCDGGCKPRLGPSPPAHRSPSNTEPMYDREAYGLRHLFACPSPEGAGACESPPQPTSPTQTSRDSTLRRPSDERHHRRLESVKKTSKARKSSLYMPLSVAYPVRPSRTSPGARASSRSAPATPCGALVPNLLTFTQRVSASRYGSRSSRCEEESNPLLADIEHEHSRADHKF
ncbi:uncharacterized protein LOC126367790 isoform X2 [Pectinophora gossypiella]|uniref:uncharacterized protein LOC126367790 isoform X2 n=1 Tax=Pectinophora gossypiella TaxID=13191 RepID=UPI00214E1C0C|nr:uncharacterized protein LOC126367790 isoform X2 [Pectinophora gossypiella]